jgi:hypothetical protein
MKSAKELFKDSWLFFKSHWTTLVVISVGFGIAGYIYNNLLTLLLSGIFESIFDSIEATWLIITFGFVALVVFLAYLLGGIILSAIQNMIMPYATHELLEERPLMFKDSAKKLLRMTPSYLWLTILMTLIISGGLILLIIPGIYFASIFSLAIMAFIVDGKRGFAALAHSLALFKGRFWLVIGKLAYPILYPLALFALIAALVTPLLIFVESWWIKAPILIVLGIPTFAALFIFLSMSIAYTIKLYRELTTTTLADVSFVPKWLKVWSWIGTALLLILIAGTTIFIVKNPAIVEKIKKEINKDSTALNAYTDLSPEELAKVQTYADFGLAFDHPGRFADMGPNEMNGSLTVLTDVTSPSMESGYMPQISILGFEPKEEVRNLSALELLKRNFVPDFEEAKKTGEVTEYAVVEKTFNGHTFAILTAKELIEGQAVVSQSTIYKDQKTIYLFQAIALESEKDSLNQALDQIFGTIKISEMVLEE